MAKPEKDEVRMAAGQRYVCIGFEPWVTRSGENTTLAVWRTHCAECGRRFDFMYSTRTEKFAPSRRCSEHSRPGVQVGRKKRKRAPRKKK